MLSNDYNITKYNVDNKSYVAQKNVVRNSKTLYILIGTYYIRANPLKILCKKMLEGYY